MSPSQSLPALAAVLLLIAPSLAVAAPDGDSSIGWWILIGLLFAAPIVTIVRLITKENRERRRAENAAAKQPIDAPGAAVSDLPKADAKPHQEPGDGSASRK